MYANARTHTHTRTHTCTHTHTHTHTHTGEMYRHGQGVEENIDEAINHYRKGADLGMKEISMHHDSSS